jgi:hypothetical protein
MREAVQYASWLVGLPLELLIIGALLRGPYRRFPLLFLYSLALFLTTVIEVSVSQPYFSGIRLAHSPGTYYWIDEGIRQGLLFALVLSLACLATSQLRSRNLVRLALIAGGIALALASFLVHKADSAGSGKWWVMSLWVRDLDFMAAVIDLALWALLLTSRLKDAQLLLISGGLGIMFAGGAIGESARYLSHRWSLPRLPADLVPVATSLAALWVLWQALRPVPLPRRVSVALPPSGNGTDGTRRSPID